MSSRLSLSSASAPRLLEFTTTPATLIAAAALLGALMVGTLTAASAPLGVGLALALCYAPLVLINPQLGIALWVGITFVEKLPIMSVGPTAAGLLIIAAWIGTLRSRRAYVATVLAEHRRLLLGTALLLVWITLSAVWATDPGLVGSELLGWYLAAITLLIVATTIASPRHLVLIALAFVGGAVLSVLIGLATTGFTGAANAGDSATFIDGRLRGGAGDPNYLAAGLVPAIVLAGALIAHYRDPMTRWSLGVAIIVMTIGLAATQSRGGFIAAAVALVAALIIQRRKIAVLAMLGLVIVAAGAWFAVSPSALERIESIDDGGTGRSELWAIGWQIFEEHPVAGVGLNNFRAESFRYVREPGNLEFVHLISERPDIVHNVYLQSLVETGVIGFGLLLFVMLACLRAAWRAARRFDATGRSQLADLSRSYLIASIAMLVSSFFVSNATDSRLWVLLAIGPVLLAVSNRPVPTPGR
jgi:O-antigen ligase